MRARLLVGILAVSTSILLAQTPEKMEGLDASTVETVISAGLATAQVGNYSKVQGLEEWVSDYAEFSSHLVQTYRARYDFRLEGNVLWVTMRDLQGLGPDGWGQSLIPAKGAEQKLILQMVGYLNAARRTLPPSQLALVNATPPMAPGAPGRDPLRPGQPASPNQQPRLPLERASAAGTSQTAPMAAVEPRDTNASQQSDKVKSMIFDKNGTHVCSEGLCAVQKDGKWGFVDYQGNLVLDFKYTSAVYAAPIFLHGTCLIQLPHEAGQNYHYGFIDKKGNPLFGNRKFAMSGPFDDVVARVTLDSDSHLYLLDLKGNLIVANDFSRDLTAKQFHDGLIRWQDSGPKAESLWGFRNSKDQWAIPPIYIAADDFNEGIAWVAKGADIINAKWGAIDTSGKEVVPFIYGFNHKPFSDGMAAVSCNNPRGWGYINTTGDLVIPCGHGDSSPFIHGHATFNTVPFPELIDKQGNVFAGFTEKKAPNDRRPRGNSLRSDGLYTYNGQFTVGLLDADWNELIPADHFLSIGLFPADEDPDGLAWASEKQGNKRFGFINRHGQFVLVQQESRF
jgi:hypothetical protein